MLLTIDANGNATTLAATSYVNGDVTTSPLQSDTLKIALGFTRNADLPPTSRQLII